MTKRLRNGTPKVPTSTKITTTPANYGYSIKMRQSKVIRKGNTARITGTDFAGNVNVVNATSYEPCASVLLNPAYFSGAMLGSLSRTYEKYKFNKVSIEYVPAAPTSTTGQLVFTSSRSVKEPFLDGTSSSFLGRALSQSNATASPLWLGTSIQIEPNNTWSMTDPLIDADLDDSISEEIQVYGYATTTFTCGVLLIHYDIEFKDPLYTYHATQIPVAVGISSFITLRDDSDVNATTDIIRLASPSITLGAGSGAIYRLVFRQAASILPTGPASWAAFASVITASATTTSAYNVGSQNITCVPGTVFYGVLDTQIVLYSSYDAAAAGLENGAINYQTATTAKGTYAFCISLVRLSNVNIMTVQ
jgi:hypothetical protein